MNRGGVPESAGDASRISYCEMINARLLAGYLAWSVGGVCGSRPPFVREVSDVCVFRGRVSPSPLEIFSQNDEGVWEGVWQLCECCTCEGVCIYRWGEIARDNGCFGAII